MAALTDGEGRQAALAGGAGRLGNQVGEGKDYIFHRHYTSQIQVRVVTGVVSQVRNPPQILARCIRLSASLPFAHAVDPAFTPKRFERVACCDWRSSELAAPPQKVTFILTLLLTVLRQTSGSPLRPPRRRAQRRRIHDEMRCVSQLRPCTLLDQGSRALTLEPPAAIPGG